MELKLHCAVISRSDRRVKSISLAFPPGFEPGNHLVLNFIKEFGTWTLIFRSEPDILPLLLVALWLNPYWDLLCRLHMEMNHRNEDTGSAIESGPLRSIIYLIGFLFSKEQFLYKKFWNQASKMWRFLNFERSEKFWFRLNHRSSGKTFGVSIRRNLSIHTCPKQDLCGDNSWP